MPRFLVSRRSLLAGTAAAAALVALPRAGRAQGVVKGGRLVVAADSEPTNLNPAIVASNGVFFVASKVVEPLAEASYEGTDGLAPKLATSWEGSADGKSVTFKLREGVTWHDGKPFTSADVAFSALSVWKPLQNLGRAGVQEPRGRRHAGRAHRDLPLLDAHAAPAHPQRAAGAYRGRAEARL